MNTARKVILELQNIKMSEENIELFYNQYFNLGNIGVISATLRPGKSVFRSRLNKPEKPFLSIDQISYPPFSPGVFGRANYPNTSMFYGSYTPELSGPDEINLAYVINAYEISDFLLDDASIGVQKITIGKWRVIDDLRLAAIIFHERYIGRTILLTELNNGFKKYLNANPAYKESTIEWNNFISGEFAKKVNEIDLHEYIISASFSSFLINEKGFDGILYPTVRLDGRGLNIAIKPEAVDKKLRLELVGETSFYKKKKRTFLDWERICVVKNPLAFEFKNDPEKIGEAGIWEMLEKMG